VFLSIGPSYVTAKRDVVVDTGFQEGAAPFTNVTLNPRTERRSKGAWGAELGATFTYRVARYAGVSASLRWLGSEPRVQGLAGPVKATVGGVSIGGGFGLFF
jgi:hypothetical protein